MRIRYSGLVCLGLLIAAQSASAGSFFDDMRIRGGLAGGQLGLDDSSYSAHAAGWNLTVGFEFNRYLAVELGHLDGGTAVDESFVLALVQPLPPASPVYDQFTNELETRAWHSSAIATLPLNDDVSIYGRGGLMNWHATARSKQNGVLIAPVVSDKGTEPFYGAGVAINVDDGLLRLEYTLSKIDNFDLRYVSLGIVWRFGF